MNPSSSSASSEGQSPDADPTDGWLFLSSEVNRPQPLEEMQLDEDTEDQSKLKSKLVSAWNSVKYGQFLHAAGVLTVQNCNKEKNASEIMINISFQLYSYSFPLSNT